MSMSTEPAPAPPRSYNFAAALFATNASRPRKLAYVDDTRSLTYGALETRAKQFASALYGLGLRREERILLVLLDTVDLPVAFLGALYAGVVPVVVNTLLPAADYAFMLEHSGARAVFVSGTLAPKLTTAVATAGDDSTSLPFVVSQPESAGSAYANGTTDFAALVDDAPPLPKSASTHADDAAFWLYSSGSTGRPKGTVHSHANLYYTAELYAKPIMGIRESDVVFSAAKLFFAYGLGNSLTFPLSVGATVVLMAGRATPEALFAKLAPADATNAPTIFCGAPTTFVALLASPALPPRARFALRVCTSAGEALPLAVGTRFTEHFGCEILDGVGSTEMLHIYLSNRPGDVVYGTSGTAVPGYDLELRDDDGVAVPTGEVGELWVRGPSVAMTYWRERAKSQATFVGAWMKTGDKYHRLDNGRFVYGGRSDDMLKVSGQYVAPAEVESVLLQHESVLEVAVVGQPDDAGLIRTCAFVVVRTGHASGDSLASALKAFVKERLAPHKYPRDVVFVADLPKTATGKIQRFMLRAQRAAGS